MTSPIPARAMYDGGADRAHPRRRPDGRKAASL